MLALAGDLPVPEKLEPALGIVAQTTLGAIALICICVAIFAVYKLSSVQDKRATDAKEASEKLAGVVSQMASFQTETTKAIESLVLAERQGEYIAREQTNLLQQMKQSFDTTIRDAILINRRPTPTPGTYHAVQPPASRGPQPPPRRGG